MKKNPLDFEPLQPLRKEGSQELHALDFDHLFVKAEKAIQAHPKLRGGIREGKPGSKPVEWSFYPSITVTRLGFNFDITVGLKGSRKKASEIRGEGDSPEEAVDNLIANLDYWAEAIK